MRCLGCFVQFVLAVTCGFCQGPLPPFIWHFDFSYSDMVSASQIVVVGRVRALNLVGPDVRAADDHGSSGTWRLVKVEAEREDVLSGDISGDSFEFFYYTNLGPATGNWNSLHVGDRCVFLLNREGGVLRAVRDYWRSDIEIGTGRHSPSEHDANLTVKERIAVLLLTPGVDLNPRRLARVLPEAVSLGDEWLGGCRTTALLKSLLEYPDGEVQGAAGEQLSFRLQSGCTGR